MPRTTDDVLPPGHLRSRDQPPARRQGVATAALQTLSDWAMGDVGFHRVWLMHSTQNAPSCKVAEATGHAPEGTLREALLHADGWHDMHVHGRVADSRRCACR